MKLANKISLSFLITAIIVTGIVAPIFYTMVKDVLQKSIFEHLTTTVYSRARHIETFLQANLEIVEQLSKSVVLERLLLTNKEDKDDGQRLNDVIYRLKNTAKVSEHLYEFFVLNKEGIIVASSEEEDIGCDKSADAYFLGAKESPFIKDAYISEHKKEPSLSFSAPVRDDRTEEFLGVIVARSNLAGLNTITIDRTGLGQTGEIYLVNKYGYMITPSRFLKGTFLKLKVDSENAREAFRDIKKFGAKECKHRPLIYTDYRGRKVLGIHDRISLTQWVLLAEIDVKEALAPLVKIKILFVSIMVFAPLLAFLLGLFISKTITKPIRKLHKDTEIIGKGNLDYKVATDAKDEIGQLSRAFDKMTGDLKVTTTSIDKLNKEIEQRKKVEEELKESGDRLHLALSAADMGTWRWNIKTDQDTRDASFNRILGLKEAESTQSVKDFVQHVHPDDRAAAEEEIKRVIREHDIYRIEFRIVRPDGAIRWLSDRGKMHYDQKNEPVYMTGAVFDITARKEAEKKLKKAYKELKKTQAQLIQSEKLAAIGQLASGGAHEINNPLTVISGEAEMLLGKKDKDTKDAAKTIVEQAKRIKTITQRLLEFSRKREVELEPLNINDAVKESLSLLTYQAKIENIKIVKELDPHLPKVLADNNQIQEVFLNIMLNAIQAMEKAGSLTIRTRCEKIIEYKRKKTDKFKKGQKIAIIEFKDTGCGMDEEALKKVFDPFFTTKEESKSTGLGLSICYGIIRSHKGIIEAQSKLGKGSTFIVKLPVMGGGK